MQSYIEIPENNTLSESRSKLLNNDKTIMSCSSGTVFPTLDLQIGMLCLRTDEMKLYELKDATPTWKLIFDLNKTATDKEYVDAGLSTKQATLTGAATTIASSNLTASRAVVSDAGGKVAVSAVTVTELGYLSGVTSSIQTQLGTKLNKAGDTMTGALTLSGDATASLHAVTKQQMDTADATKVSKAGDAFTGGMREARVAMGADNIDCNAGNYFSKTLGGATTFTVSNVPSAGTVASFVLDLTNGGAYAITWWSGVKWASGTAPTLTSSGRDVLGFFTHDGGTTWTGLVLGKDVK